MKTRPRIIGTKTLSEAPGLRATPSRKADEARPWPRAPPKAARPMPRPAPRPIQPPALARAASTEASPWANAMAEKPITTRVVLSMNRIFTVRLVISLVSIGLARGEGLVIVRRGERD